MWTQGETRVFAVADVDLRATDGVWDFANRHREEIAAHWQRRVRETPGFFNGTVHLLTEFSISEGEILRARFVRADFRSFLYWRETGWRDSSVMDAFGSALIISAERQVLLGRQRGGNLNSGLCYPPGGFIDVRDVRADGTIDIDASVLREIAEETGLGIPPLQRAGGYVITLAGPVLSIAVPLRSDLPAEELALEVGRHIAADPKSELQDLVFATPGDRAAGLPMPDYALALLRNLPRLKTLD